MDKRDIEALDKFTKEVTKAINISFKMIIWLAKRLLPFHEFEDFTKEFTINIKDGE